MKKISVIGIGKLGLCFALTLEKAGYSVLGLDINPEYVNKVNKKILKSDEQGVEEALKASSNFKATLSLRETVNFCNYLYVVVATPSLKSGRYDHSQVNNLAHDLKKVGDVIEKHYEDMTVNTPKVCRMSRTEAEICKISLNCFLTTKIAFANMIGDIALNSDCRPDIILNAIGSDSRVGNKYLGFGFGYGGPCFPRDNRALAIYSEDVGIRAMISIASDESNKAHLQNQVNHYIRNNKEKTVQFDFVTYKPESTMLEESQQLEYAVLLAKKGYKVIINERKKVIQELKRQYGSLFEYKERK